MWNETMPVTHYKGYSIERNHYGHYTAWMNYNARYIQCECLKDVKAAIKEDIENVNKFTCKYERKKNENS